MSTSNTIKQLGEVQPIGWLDEGVNAVPGEIYQPKVDKARPPIEAQIEHLCESRSIGGVIEADCRELAVSLYPAGGFASLSLAYQAATYIEQEAAGKPAVILYIGDY